MPPAPLPAATPRRDPMTPGMIALLALLSAFGPMSIDMYLPALPTLARDFRGTPADIQLTLTAFVIAFGFGQIVYGPLGDRFGRKPVLLGGVALYTVASALCALAADSGYLVALRFLQGLGACAGSVMARAMVRDLAERDRAAQVMSIMMACVGLAPMLAPLVGSELLERFGWRAIFWLLTGFGITCLLAGGLGTRETLKPEHIQKLTPGPLARRYVALATTRDFVGYGLTGGFLFAAMFSYISGSSFVFIDRYGFTPREYGLLFGLNIVTMISGATLNSRMARRFGAGPVLRRVVWVPLIAGSALIVAGVVETRTGMLGPWPFIPLCMALVGSMSVVAPNSTASAMQRFPHMAGTASSLLGLTQFGLGAVFGVAVGHLLDGTILPMAAFMGLGGVLCFTAHRALVRA
ncbi:MAG: Bcr/CflA family multidrug efflux MFS transporter [Rhodospirillales bacterium]|nr:MAG: Bcr/CflA family multidrug efflux MFS transporter [Rhodospirillales bacterium]